MSDWAEGRRVGRNSIYYLNIPQNDVWFGTTAAEAPALTGGKLLSDTNNLCHYFSTGASSPEHVFEKFMSSWGGGGF